jgi:hypothetical protein
MPLLALSNVMFLFLKDTFIQLDITGRGEGGAECTEKNETPMWKYQLSAKKRYFFSQFCLEKEKFFTT